LLTPRQTLKLEDHPLSTGSSEDNNDYIKENFSTIRVTLNVLLHHMHRYIEENHENVTKNRW